MRISSLRVKGLWSFGEGGLNLEDLGQHNLIIGRNNTGKSKVLQALRFAMEQAEAMVGPDQSGFSLGKAHAYDDGSGTTIRPELQLEWEADARASRNLELVRRTKLGESWDSRIEKHLPITGPVKCRVLHDPSKPEGQRNSATIVGVPSVAELVATYGLEGKVTEPVWGGKVLYPIIRPTATALKTAVRYISGWRTMGMSVDGGTITQRLHQWSAPTYAERHSIRKFEAVQSVFRRLMLDDCIKLCPQHDGAALHLRVGKQYLPLDQMGDGVQHLLMVAFHLVTQPDALLMIEEPETHLHPELQRNMAAVIREHAMGQTFLTTHSSCLLDAGFADRVYRVEHDGSSSHVMACSTSRDLRQVLDDLDVRASDILQANLVIWVEGPTDRMFIRKCIEARSASLVEGVHYQFVYYGGTVRSHLQFGDDLGRDLIDVMRLGRHTVMVCDSDRGTEGSGISATKDRLRGECEGVGGLYWVTDGREIENYLTDEAITAAYQELTGDPDLSITLGQYDKLGQVAEGILLEKAGVAAWVKDYEHNKTRMMPVFLRHFDAKHCDRWGLQARITQLLSHIETASPGACRDRPRATQGALGSA